MNGRSSVFDFTLHWALKAMCEDAGFDMRQMNGAGYAARDPLNAHGNSKRPDQLLGPPVPSPFTDVLYSAERGVAGRKATHVQRRCQHR